MTSTETPNSDVIQLNSADLMRILQSGGINLENMDFMNMDPGLAQQIQQLRQTQQTSDPNLNPAAVRQQRPRPSTSRQPSRGTQAVGPYVEIVEQPKARGLRFRYECEGRSAGSIPGENSTPERKIFPSIKIHNYNGPAVIVVSCVTKDEPYKPHPHNLVGKDCKKGVCTLRIRDTSTVSFPHLGIQCAKKKDHRGQNIDLNVVRLCFQVFLPDEQGKITRIVQPVVSQAIHDKKALNDLVICRVDKTSGKSKGGDEVFLLCEKINRDDVRVRFFEEREGQIIWEAFGDFGQNDVHRQYAIVFKTPPYSNQYIQQPVEVEMQLQRSSDLEGSDPIKFTYQPEDPDPDRIMEKRKRKAANLNFLESGGSQVVTQETLKQRLKLKATRTSAANRGKQEPMIKEEDLSKNEIAQNY
ncbi:DORS-like protein [Mya arenaria]|uniref:DORS-like protein n=1 Tax=Mya arenaria TaxID=6604 RepID=A0ABY7FD06_MYAAR|nr:DORS-like protein [Mya arenaria]